MLLILVYILIISITETIMNVLIKTFSWEKFRNFYLTKVNNGNGDYKTKQFFSKYTILVFMQFSKPNMKDIQLKDFLAWA